MNIHISEISNKTVGVDFFNQFLRMYKYCDKYDVNFHDRNVSWLKGIQEFIDNFNTYNINIIFVLDNIKEHIKSSNADQMLERIQCDYILTNDNGIKGLNKLRIDDEYKIVGSEVAQNYIIWGNIRKN